MDSDPAARMQKELNKLKLAGIDAGEKLLPLVTQAGRVHRERGGKFSGLSDKQQGDLLGRAVFFAASGPALKVIGGVTRGLADRENPWGQRQGRVGILGKLPCTIEAEVGAAAAVTGIALKAMREKGRC